MRVFPQCGGRQNTDTNANKEHKQLKMLHVAFLLGLLAECKGISGLAQAATKIGGIVCLRHPSVGHFPPPFVWKLSMYT